jgi:hypothetical protein
MIKTIFENVIFFGWAAIWLGASAWIVQEVNGVAQKMCLGNIPIWIFAITVYRWGILRGR